MPHNFNLTETMKGLKLLQPLRTSRLDVKDWFRFDKSKTPDERNPQNTAEFLGHIDNLRTKISDIAKDMASIADMGLEAPKDNDTVDFPVDITETEGNEINRTFRFRMIKVYRRLRSDGGYIEKNGNRNPKSRFYELWVPRFESSAMSSNTATHSVLNQLLKHTIPIPHLVHFGTSDNALGHSFTIYEGIEGIPVISALQQHRIGRKGRLCISKQMAAIYAAMDSFKTLIPGKIDTTTSTDYPVLRIMDARKSAINGKITTFAGYQLYEYFPWYEASSRLELPSTIMTDSVLAYLTNRLENFSTTCSGVDGIISKQQLRSLYSKLIYILHFIDTRTSVFSSNPNYHLIHNELDIQNILVLPIDPNNEEGEWAVKSVLDWSSAYFGPRVMLWKPPTWLWKDISSFDGLAEYVFHRLWAEEEESPAYPSMAKKEKKPAPKTSLLTPHIALPDSLAASYLPEVRKVFEDQLMAVHGVADYQMMAYHPLCQLARRVVTVALDGVTVGSEREVTNLKAVEELLAMWNRVNESGIIPEGEKGMKLEMDW